MTTTYLEEDNWAIGTVAEYKKRWPYGDGPPVHHCGPFKPWLKRDENGVEYYHRYLHNAYGLAKQFPTRPLDRQARDYVVAWHKPAEAVRVDMEDSVWRRPAKTTVSHRDKGADHYKGQHEPFDVILEWQKRWPKEIVFHCGNVVKYISRLGRKDDAVSELEKIIVYAQEAKAVVSKERV